MAKWVTIGKVYVFSTTSVGRRGVDVAPADAVLAEDVGRREPIVGAKRRILDQRRRRREGRRQGEDGGQLLVLDPDEAGGLLGGVLRLGCDDRHGLAVVLRLADGDDRPVRELGTEARHRLGQVGRGHDEAHAGERERRARVDRDDPGPRAVERDEPCLEGVRQPDVGHVLGEAGDPADSADAVGRAANSLRSHRWAPSATARTASLICS